MQVASRPPSSHPVASPNPQARPYQVNTETIVLDTHNGRLLCIADIRGKLSSLNDLARDANAKAIIHTGDFGFFEASSLDRINDRTLRHLTQYSPLIPGAQRAHLLSPDNPPAVIRSTVNISLLSEFPLLLSGQIKLQVPVFTLWGACEDVQVLEKFRAGTYRIDNLHIIDEATTRCLDVGGVKLRILGLGGALVPHKMFDNGEGSATIAGGQGTMWTTALQIGELVDTAQRVFDPTETRLLISHASPGREGIISQLALILKADLTVSAGLHFRYGSSYNDFSVQGDFEGFRHKLVVGKESFDKVWENVKSQVDAVIDENQRVLLDKFLSVVERVPPAQTGSGPGASTLTGEEPAWKNCWNWNLCDAAYGSLVLDVKDGRISSELKSQGFNYAYRRTATTVAAASQPAASASSPTAPSAPTPAPEKAIPPHLANRSAAPSPSPAPAPASGRGTPAQPAAPPKTNGTASPAPTPPPTDAKGQSKKDKKKEKREAAKSAAAGEDAGEASTSDTAPAAPGPATEGEPPAPTSPTTESTGGRTPTSKRPPRNPWTLFIRMEVPANEEQLRAFFGEAKAGITRVNYPQSTFAGRLQKIAYVEFGDEEAMKAGLEKHEEKLNDSVPDVRVAQDKEQRAESGEYRGRGRGRGGRGGFAARGFAAAGLTRGGAPSPSPKPNGGVAA